MERATAFIATALLLAACGQGLTEEEVQAQIDASIDRAMVTTTNPDQTTTTTSPEPTTTSEAAPVTTTTSPLPPFPSDRTQLEHGGETWAVILAVSTGFGDPLLTTAVLAAEAAGYPTGPTDCDLGVVEALALPEERHYYSVSVYFETEADANAARDAFLARGIGAVSAQVQTLCLD